MINKRLLFLVWFFLSITISVFAQENQRSEEIKWIDGQKFYIHKVTQGQGLYTIKKLYGVEEKDILENNPEVFDGLKLGQELKIPFIKKEPKDLGYRIHIIEAGQSIYSISKIYNVSQESIFALNPKAKNGYKINQKLKIPLEEKENLPEENEQENKNKKVYKVKKKDTLYSLSKKFGITQEALLEANPIIAKEGLKKGQKIIIPRKEVIIKEALYMPLDTMHYSEISLLDDTVSCENSIIERYTPMNVGLFLPFEIDKMAFEQESEKSRMQKPQISGKPFLEFYEAFLIAINELKAEGLKINIHTFNTKRDSNEIKRILKKGIIQDLDLIIGPVYEDNFKIVQNATDSMSIPMINPIIQGTDVVNWSSYTIDMFPSDATVANQICKLIIQNDTSNIYFVHSGFVDDLVIVEPFKKAYLNTLLNAGKDTSNYFKELMFSDSKKMDLKSHISKEESNLIIVLSDNQAFVSNVFTKLNILTEEYQIQMVARPKWQKFDNIDVNYYHNLKTLQITSDYVDYTKDNVISFVKEYRNLYNLEPSKYAFYAYDLTLNFTQYFYKWEKMSCLTKFDFSGTSMDFDLKKTKSGWTNQSVFIIQYEPDYTLKRRISN